MEENFYTSRLKKIEDKLDLLNTVITIHTENFKENYEEDFALRECLDKFIKEHCEEIIKCVK